MNHLGFHILDTFNIDDSKTKESIDMLNQCHDLNLVGPISSDIIDRIKIALYKHMRNHLIDLNEIQAIKMIKSIKHEESTRSN